MTSAAQNPLTGLGAPFAVTELEVAGRPVPVYANGPQVLPEVLTAAELDGVAPVLIDPVRSYSYDELRCAACALAWRMAGVYGLHAGDRVVIAMGNRPEWLVTFWAAQLSGLIIVPLNPRWEEAELTAALRQCSPRLLVVDEACVERISSWRDAQPAEGRPWLLTLHPRSRLGVRWEQYEDLPSDGPREPPTFRPSPDSVAAILYTSGTTGRPKGVVLTQRNLCAAGLNGLWPAARAAAEAGRAPIGRRPIRTLMTFPFFHSAGLTAILAAMIAGGTLVVLDHWDPRAARQAMGRHDVAVFAGTPSNALELLLEIDGDSAPAGLRQISTGGAAAPPELVRQVGERFGGRVEAYNGYGLTETSGRVITTGGERYRRHPNSIGTPSPATRARIMAAGGVECSEGQVGELQISGQGVFSGYWEDPLGTEYAFDQGWFKTGDLAYLRDGEFYLVDRVKDVVVRRGVDVYCIEIESVLFEHPDVVDAAVVGVPHREWGEEVAALLVLRSGAVFEPEVMRAHLAARLIDFKVPTRIVLRDALPRNANGKVLKRDLRAELVAGIKV